MRQCCVCAYVCVGFVQLSSAFVVGGLLSVVRALVRICAPPEFVGAVVVGVNVVVVARAIVVYIGPNECNWHRLSSSARSSA